MTERKRRNVSPETRAALSARLSALNADPVVKAKQIAARARPWTAERRARMAALPPRPLALPEHAHPVVRGLYVEMNDQLATLEAVSARSGVGYDTLRFWRRYMPRLDTIDAALGALDLELAIVPRGTRDRNGFPKKKNGNTKTGAEE